MANPRLTGVDVARGIALIGMFATHTMPLVETHGGESSPTWVALFFAGKSSALFATLAGVGLALLTARSWRAEKRGSGKKSGAKSTRGASSSSAPTLTTHRKAIATRAACIIAIGFFAAEFSSGIAVILVHYGVLFLLALLIIQLSIKQLIWLGAGWLLISPVVLFFARAWAHENVAPYRTSGPVLMDLFRPQTFAADLLATGYYPLIVWPVYLIAGLAMGRILHEHQGSWSIPWRLMRLGFTMTFAAYLISWSIIGRNTPALAHASGKQGSDLHAALLSGQGLTQLEASPWWFVTSSPHASTQLDLLLTVGTSMFVLGICLVVCRLLEEGLKHFGTALTWPLAGAGAATLTLYVGHIIALDIFSGAFEAMEPIHRWLLLTVIALLFGVFVKWKQKRGPLEWMVHSLAAHASGQAQSSTQSRNR